MGSERFPTGNTPGKPFEFRCAECGEVHAGSPSIGYRKPPQYFDIPEQERSARIFFDPDRCAIDDRVFFIRGLLRVPIIGVEDPFLWGLWVSQSEESFKRYVASFGEDQSGDGSFGWLLVDMPGYDRTAKDEPPEQLACNVVWQAGGKRPLIEPQECDHPLYLDFISGISWDRAIELATRAIHEADG